MLKPNTSHHQEVHESSFPKIRLANGNVVKFSHTNRKHFTVDNPMAFPIVKMGNKKTSKTSSSPLHNVDPHPIQQCLGPPHAPPQTAAPTVEALSHTYAAKSPLVTMARPKFDPKVPLPKPIPKPHYLPNPWTRPTYDAKRHPDLIRCFSTMHWTDRRMDVRTHGQTDVQTRVFCPIAQNLLLVCLYVYSVCFFRPQCPLSLALIVWDCSLPKIFGE